MDEFWFDKMSSIETPAMFLFVYLRSDNNHNRNHKNNNHNNHNNNGSKWS